MIDINKVHTPHSSCGVKSQVSWSFLCNFIDRLEGLSLNTFGHWHPSLVSISVWSPSCPSLSWFVFGHHVALSWSSWSMQFVPPPQDGFNLACHPPLASCWFYSKPWKGAMWELLLSGAYGVGNESRLIAKGLARRVGVNWKR